MAAPKTKLFVGHLPDNCTDDDLRNLFSKYGEVTECDVINKYGFVHMASSEEADQAVKNLNNYNLMGSSISVEPSKSKLHPEPGAPGRANKETVMNRRGGQTRNGFGPPRGGFGGGFGNGYRDFGGRPRMGGDSFYDRPFGFGGRDRMRPYPPPYERSNPGMGPMREDFGRRPMPPMGGGGDPYARSMPPMSMRDDLYERRPMQERSDYLYSRRSPPASSMRSPYWYDSPIANGNSRALPPTATRRPAYF